MALRAVLGAVRRFAYRPLPLRRYFASPSTDEQRYLEALRENERLYPSDHQLLAQSHKELAKHYLACKQPDQGLRHSLQQFQLLHLVSPQPSADLLDVGRLCIELLYSEFKYADCEALASRLVEIAKQAYPANGLEVARAHFMLSHLKEVQGKLEEAVGQCLQAVEIVKQHKEPEFLSSLFQTLGSLKKNQGQHPEAETYISTSLSLLEDSQSPAKDDLRASAYCVKGENYAAQGQFQQSEDCFKRALALRRSAKEPNQGEIANCLNSLGMLYLTFGRLPEAELLFKEKLEIDKVLYTEQHPATANSYHNLAAVDEAKGNFQGAKGHFLKALSIRQHTLPPTHPHIPLVHQNLVGISLALQELDEAERHAKLAEDLGRQAYPEDHPFMATAHFDLGVVQDAREQLDQSLASHLKALELRLKSYAEEHQLVGSSYLCVGQAYKKLNQVAKANECYHKGYSIMKKVLDDDHPDLATMLNNMGSINYSQGHFAEAEEDLRRSLNLRLRSLPDHSPAVITTRANLAAALMGGKKLAEAESELKTCLSLVEQRKGEAGLTPELVARMLFNVLKGQKKEKEAAALAKHYGLS